MRDCTDAWNSAKAHISILYQIGKDSVYLRLCHQPLGLLDDSFRQGHLVAGVPLCRREIVV